MGFEGNALAFEGRRIEPSVRTLQDMLPALRCPQEAQDLPLETPTYFMYREAGRFGQIRYDVTRIMGLDVGCERNKTFGHTHPKSESGTEWPEVYEVLAGTAHFLLQKADGRGGASEACLLDAGKGDCLLIPPGYGHVTINAGGGELVLANLVSDGFEADYSLFRDRCGGCWHELSDGTLAKNERYGSVPPLERMGAMEFSSAFACFAPFKTKGLLEAAKNAGDIEFLGKPGLFR